MNFTSAFVISADILKKFYQKFFYRFLQKLLQKIYKQFFLGITSTVPPEADMIFSTVSQGTATGSFPGIYPGTSPKETSETASGLFPWDAF